MNERNIVQEFVKQARVAGCYYIHKDGDTYGGHKKPYDLYIVWKGRFFAVEVKNSVGVLTDFQFNSLNDVDIIGGGCGFVARIAGRDLTFYPINTARSLGEARYTLRWYKGKYIDIKDLPANLLTVIEEIL